MRAKDKVKYHLLDEPLNPKVYPEGVSDLNTIYPGRPVTYKDDLVNMDRNGIMHENPVISKEVNKNRKRQVLDYAKALENTARLEGGGDAAKIVNHSSEDPYDMNNNPDNKSISLPEIALNGVPRPPPIASNQGEEFITEHLKEGFKNNQEDKDKPKNRTWLICVWIVVILLLVLFFNI